MTGMKRYEALITRADALGDEADRLGTGSVNVSNTAACAISDDVTALVADYRGAVEALQAIYDRHHMNGDGSAGQVSGDALRALGFDPDRGEA